MEKKKAVAPSWCGPVTLIQIRNSIRGSRQQVVIVGQRFAGRIYPIGEQRVAHISIGIGQVVNFQVLYLLADSILRSQQGRDYDDRRSEEHTSELQSLRHLVCR